jgi:hypothetical protein
MDKQGRVTEFAFDYGAEGEKIGSFHVTKLYQQKPSRCRREGFKFKRDLYHK